MHSLPPVPRVDDAPEALLAEGHLWLQELIDGAQLRFQLRDSGLLRFGGSTTVFETGDVPLPYRHAVRHVRERFDREALREAVDDVESLVFFGEATSRHAVDYDWERLPPFLGFDVWSESKGAFLPPDAVERSYRKLGLEPVNAVRKEVRAGDFDPDVDAIPDSAWYDGPAAGVVVRNKTGERAKLVHPRFEDADPGPLDADPAELVERYATDRRLETLAARLRERGDPATTDALYDQLLEAIAREEHARLFHEAASIDTSAVRSEVAAHARRFVEDRR